MTLMQQVTTMEDKLFRDFAAMLVRVDERTLTMLNDMKEIKEQIATIKNDYVTKEQLEKELDKVDTDIKQIHKDLEPGRKLRYDAVKAFVTGLVGMALAYFIWGPK